jgi:hypothetical protein
MPEPTEQRERPSAGSLAILLLVLSVVYLFSYAPVVRTRGGWKVHAATDSFGNPTTITEPIDGDNLPFYRPVDWLIDNTPFQDPLLWWAQQCGVGSPFREGMGWRQRETRP